jgi:hypothetical protein
LLEPEAEDFLGAVGAYAQRTACSVTRRNHMGMDPNRAKERVSTFERHTKRGL